MKPKIAIFLHQPKASIQSGNGIISALSSDYEFKMFTKHELERGFFKDVDCICFPGGIGDADSYDYLLTHHTRAIRRFVERGGKYLGICMGAYWADQDYFNILDSARTVQYIKRPGTDTRRPHAKAIDIKWKRQPHKAFFYDGCAIVGDRTKFKTIATYANGDPMAIIQNNVGLIGCHMESQKHWYDDYTWMPKHWHKGEHHKLLLDFVNQLMQKS
jgi:glutamine amidotransferase-like uncharacterized protein